MENKKIKVEFLLETYKKELYEKMEENILLKVMNKQLQEELEELKKEVDEKK